MPPKRKSSVASGTRAASKKKKSDESMSADLVQSVTDNVLKTLRDAGLIPSVVDRSGPDPEVTAASTATAAALSVSSDEGEGSSDNPKIIPHKDIDDPHKFTSLAKPLGFVLDQKLKDKIRAGEFVRMYDIVYPDTKRNLMKGYVNDDGDLLFAHTTSNRRLNDIDLWRRGMMTMSSIICQQDPSVGPHLFSYIATVEKLKLKGGDWEYYDQEFRKQRAREECPWNMVDWELWADSLFPDKDPKFRRPMGGRNMNNKSGGGNWVNKSHGGGQQNGGRYGGNNDRREQVREAREKLQGFDIPKGFCLIFLAGKACEKCNFKHFCPFCKDVHPISLCKVAKKSKSGAKN